MKPSPLAPWVVLPTSHKWMEEALAKALALDQGRSPKGCKKFTPSTSLARHCPSSLRESNDRSSRFRWIRHFAAWLEGFQHGVGRDADNDEHHSCQTPT